MGGFRIFVDLVEFHRENERNVVAVPYRQFLEIAVHVEFLDVEVCTNHFAVIGVVLDFVIMGEPVGLVLGFPGPIQLPIHAPFTDAFVEDVGPVVRDGYGGPQFGIGHFRDDTLAQDGLGDAVGLDTDDDM